MNTKPTRMLLTAVALSALAAVLASSAQARIPEGNGTKPPSQTVVHEDALAELLASPAYERVPVGNGTKPPPGAVVRAQQLSQQASVREKLEEIGAWASLDPAIKGAIMARSKKTPLATHPIPNVDPSTFEGYRG
jgi:hypothetical protein